MVPELSSQPFEEDEVHFKRTFQQSWGKGWNIGFYGKPVSCPFIDNLQKEWFNAGVKDGIVAKKEFEKQPEVNNSSTETCLRCGEEFNSHGNRICSTCESEYQGVEVCEEDEEDE